jgi:hypothetical protein
MQNELITALIGATGAIIAALVGAYATMKAHDDTGLPSKKGRRNGFIILGIGSVFAIASLCAGFIFGAMHQSQKASAEQQVHVTKLTSSYQSLIDSGLTAGKSYIMPETLMLINLDKSSDGKSIGSSRRIVYALQLLSDVTPESPVFKEAYHSNFTVDRVPGADPEHDDEKVPDSKSWDVLFSGKAGDRHLVMTGAHIQMPLRLSANHEYHMFKGMSQYQDAFCYPNTDGDIMDELVIVVESRTLKLSLPGDGVDDAIIQRGDKNERVDARKFRTTSSDHTHEVIVARFRHLAKGDVAGLRVQWQP